MSSVARSVSSRPSASTDGNVTAPPGVATTGNAATPEAAVVRRFASDRFVPDERFAYLREQLGPAFVAVELEDDAANPDAAMKPHSVLTEHLIDEPGQPTRAALDQVLELFRSRLLA